MKIIINTPSKKQIKNMRVAAYLANVMDHFDTSLYGFLVPILAPLFFPQSDPVIMFIQGFGVLIVGCTTRSLGAWYFSKKADVDGPHQTLITTIIGMTITTFCFTLLQPHEYWGVWGAVGLCLLRGIQGFFGSGETSIVGLYILEKSPTNQSHPITSIYLSSTMVGILLASSTASILFCNNTPQIYWKLPFYGSIVTGLTAWYLRIASNKHEPFIKKQLIHSTSIFSDWKKILKLIPITGFSYILYSAPMIFFNSFAVAVTQINIKNLMISNTLLMIFDIWLLVLFGIIMRQMDPKKVLLNVAAITIIFMPMLFWCIPHVGFLGLVVIRIIMIIFGVAFCIPLHRWYLNEIITTNKYKVTAIGYAAGSEILGRSFPIIGFFLWHISHIAIIPGIYVSLIGLCAFLSILGIKKI